VQQHFGVPLDTLVELVVGLDGLVKTALVRHDKAGLRYSSNNQVAEVAVVCLDVALSGPEMKTLHGLD